jgi:hypothetical protein
LWSLFENEMLAHLTIPFKLQPSILTLYFTESTEALSNYTDTILHHVVTTSTGLLVLLVLFALFPHELLTFSVVHSMTGSSTMRAHVLIRQGKGAVVKRGAGS